MKGPSGGAAAFVKANLAVVILATMFAIFLLAMVVLGLLGTRHAQFDAESFALSSEQRLLSQQIAANALEAADGSADASTRLANFIRRFEQALDLLENGNPETGLPPATGGVAEALARVRERWNATRSALDTILGARDVIASVREIGSQINETVPRLIAASDRVVTTMVEKRADSELVYIASRQLLLAQRLEANVHRMLLGGTYAATAADRFGRDAALFGRVLAGLLEGSPALQLPRQTDEQVLAQLQQVEDLFGVISEQVARMLESSASMFAVIDAADEMERLSRELLTAATALEDELREHQHTQALYYNFAGVSALLMVVSLILLGYLMVRGARRRLDEQAEQNSRNQRAILRLLDELTNLADGDLTTHATVTEDITGAIADSVNYAIDALRSLVTSINRTSALVSESAETTGQTALSLSQASTRQAAEIASASAAIDDMAKSMKNVSSNAASSADVAMKSVDIAAKGADTVRLSIDGMDNIREQIQQTSKRIKRLGESSQEVGDIIGLINEIADQTNILALNAAIQASTAGEAGRGFAVVADEVQRLAERAGAATKRVEALVKTIQADTNEAVASMEQSTAGVVSGAKLAEDAGEALVEIESVSKRLAGLIQNISKEASEQADSATLLASAMNAIRDITMQTSSGTASTAESIGHLAELSRELRESVAGFKLPDDQDEHGSGTNVMRAYADNQ